MTIITLSQPACRELPPGSSSLASASLHSSPLAWHFSVGDDHGDYWNYFDNKSRHCMCKFLWMMIMNYDDDDDYNTGDDDDDDDD